jgi:hypothetical protein
MSQLKFSSQIERDLFVVDQAINEDGLLIQYIYDGKELEINIDRFDAAELLAKYGVIAATNDDGQVLEEDIDGFMKWIEWDQYVRANRLDERTAFHIAVGEESEKTMIKVVGNIKQIPALVRSILHPVKPAQ